MVLLARTARPPKSYSKTHSERGRSAPFRTLGSPYVAPYLPVQVGMYFSSFLTSAAMVRLTCLGAQNSAFN
jgi:hypothetical protein